MLSILDSENIGGTDLQIGFTAWQELFVYFVSLIRQRQALR